MYRVITAEEFWRHFLKTLETCRLANCPESDELLLEQFTSLFLEHVEAVGRA